MSPDLSEDRTFGAYHLIGLVGTGGMGVVYRAEQRLLGRVVALKVIRPEIAESGDYRARFLREARLAAAVDHPHIVPVFDFGEEAGQLYLTMQWIDGVELQRLIDRQPLEPARAVRIGTQIAAALDAIHNVGMLHRDVKPANILVRNIGGEDHAYLADFGIAKITNAQGGLTRTGWMVGTSGYLSPEQIQGQQPDARSDLYALGCVIFEALTGRRPFVGENDQALLWAHVSSPRPVASEICPGLGRRYDECLIRALAVDPHDRFQSGRELAAALEAAHTGQPGIRTPTEMVEPEKPPLPPTVTAPAPPGGRSGPPEPRVIAARPPRPAEPVTGPAPADATAEAHPRASRPARGYAGRLAVVIGSLAFLVSVTILHNYVNYGSGWRSLWQATHGEIASPLYSKDFWIPVALAGIALAGTAATIRMRGRFAMVAVTMAALGAVGYTLYLPAIGASPGFGPFGASYWTSLAAAVVMVLGAALTLRRWR
ncbi:MAG TPA: protein kinase [Streptosporangiaceae bacterium]